MQRAIPRAWRGSASIGPGREIRFAAGMNLRHLNLGLAGLLLMACAHSSNTAEPSRPTERAGESATPTSSGRVTSAPAPAPLLAGTTPRETGPAPLPRLQVTQAENIPSERVQTLFRPALSPLQHCFPGSSGKVVIRLTTVKGALAVGFEPSASLDPTMRSCATDALTKVYVQETGSNVGGPAVPPSGFTSLITVSW